MELDKQFLTKLKNSLPYNRVYYFAFGVFLLALFPKLFLILVLYLFLIRKKDIFKLIIIILGLFSIRMIIANRTYQKPPNSFTCIVTDVFDDYYYIKYNGQKVVLYTDDSLKCGDVINVKGNVKDIKSNKIPLLFDYEKYMERNYINYYINAYEIIKVDHRFHINSIRYHIFNYIDENYSRDIAPYYKSLIFGYSKDLAIKDELNVLGISHLFAISGLHILLIVSFLSKFLKEKYINIFLVFYMIITGFTPSVLRAGIMVLLKSLFKKYSFEFSNLDIISITFIILLFFNPNYIYNIGFCLSFLIVFGIALSDFKSHNGIKICLLSQALSLPIIVNINNQFNLLSVVYNIAIVGIFVKIFIPLTFITFPFYGLKIYNYLVSFFNHIVLFISNQNVGLIRIGNFSNIMIVLYYLGIFVFFKYKRLGFVSLVLLGVIFQKNLLLSQNLYIFDVGQGDTSLILSKDNVIMIDCYNGSYEYLIKKGVHEIDLLILTHNHDDHVGDLDLVLDNFDVKKILLSQYCDFDIDGNIIYAKSGDMFVINGLEIEVLSPIKNLGDENNNSLVISFDFNDKRYLFCGDIEEEAEELLVNKYKDKLKCDVLKIAHHGSDTSSTDLFLDYANPSLAIISVAEYNQYALPSDVVIKRLEKRGIKIHQTNIKNSYIDYKYGILSDMLTYNIYEIIISRKRLLMFI